MADALHLRPTGFLYGDAANRARACDKAGALAGGAIAFTQVEVIEGAAGATTRRCLEYGDVAASDDTGVQAILTRISAPRPPQAGLDMAGTLIMGVVNVTPDSFSDGGLYDEAEVAIAHAAQLALDGADIVDIGGESTRPGSDAVDRDEELRRVLPVLEGLKGGSAVISIDTRRAEVMRAGLDAGAHIINDVSALTFDDAALATAAASEAPVILMHAQGDPKTMQKNPVYDDVVLDIYNYLDARIAAAEGAGIARERIIVDPGIGFGKTFEHNLALLAEMSIFHGLGTPILLGVSRKSFIGKLGDEPDPQAREPGSIAAALSGVAQGVQIVRVHDVAATRQALAVWQAAITGRAPAA